MAVEGDGRRIERQVLHRQLGEILRADIAAGRVAPGNALPSEHQLARVHGVSRQTVRRAIADLVNAGLVERRQGKGTFVAPPRAAPAGRGGASVGVLVAHLDSWFMLDALAGIERTAAQAGFTVTIRAVGQGDLEPPGGGQPVAAEQLRDHGAVGLIVWPALSRADEGAYFAALMRAGFPVVFFDRYVKDSPVPYVVSDNFTGGRDLGRHVLGLGRRRLAWLPPRDEGATSVRERLAGIRAALSEADLPSTALHEEATLGGQPPGVRRAVQAVMAQPAGRRPEALLCGSDHIVPEVLSTLRALGARVPEDVAVTGFDDLPYAAWLNPPLTTLRQAPRMMGETATALLLEMLSGRRRPEGNVVLPVELRVRASTVPGWGTGTGDPPDRSG